MGRLLLRLLFCAVGVYVTYLVEVNVLFASGAAKLIINHISPQHFTADWSRVRSVWFARLQVRDLVLRGDDDSVQWRITATRARLSVNVPQLFAKHVHLHGAWAEGATVRVRRKLEPSEATRAFVSKLPPIAGLGDPPLKPAIRRPRATDANYNLVIVEVDDLVVEDVREVWFDTLRFTDAGGRASGGFYIKPQRMLRVAAAVDMESTKLTIGTDTVIESSDGVVGFRIPELSLWVPDRASAIHAIDAEVAGTAYTGDLSVLNPMTAKHGIVLHGGSGPLEVKVRLQRGVMQPGARAESHTHHIEATWHEHTASGAAITRALISESRAPNLVVTMGGSAIDLRHDSERVAHVQLASSQMVFRNRDLAGKFDDWSLSTDVPASDTPDLRALNGYFHQPLFLGGSAHTAFHGDFTPHHVLGSVNTVVSRAAMHVGKADATADGSAHTRMRLDLDAHEGDMPEAALELHDVAVNKEHGWWVNAAFAPLELAFGDSFSASFFVTGKARDGKTPLEAIGVPGIVEMLVGGQGVTSSATVHVGPSLVEVPDLRVIGSSIEVRGRFRAHESHKSGRFVISLPLTNLGLTVDDAGVSPHLFVDEHWYEGR